MSVKLREKEMKDGSSSFYLDIYFQGKRNYEFLNIYVSNKRKDIKENGEKRKLAEKIRSQREYEMILKESGLNDPKKKHGDFIAFFERMTNERKVKRNCQNVIKHLKRYIGENNRISFNEMTTQWLMEFQRHLSEKYKPNSVFTYFKWLNVAFNIAVEQKIITDNPLRGIPKSKRIRGEEVDRTFLTIEEINKLASADTKTNKQVKQIFLFSCFTGLRWGDVNKLKWEDFDNLGDQNNERIMMRFRQKKTGTYEYMPISEQAIEILKERKNDFELFKESNPEGFKKRNELELGKTYVFPFTVELLTDRELVNKWINHHLKKWAADAGLKKNLHFHASRHTFATLALTYGTDLYTVSKLLGHKNIQTTTIYAKVIDKLKTEAVAKLPVIGK